MTKVTEKCFFQKGDTLDKAIDELGLRFKNFLDINKVIETLRDQYQEVIKESPKNGLKSQ